MSKAPYFKFYVSDFLGDTMHLSAEEVGAYTLLLCAMWNAGGHLSSDPKVLGRIARVHPPRWPKVWSVLARFFELGDDTITQKRLHEEAVKVHKISSVRSEVGKSGVEAKSLKNKEPASAIAERLLEQTDSKSSLTRARSKSIAIDQKDNHLPLENVETQLDGAGAPSGKGSRLPADWRPIPDLRAYARQQGFDEAAIDRIAEDFRDYWVAKPGAAGRKTDWAATWRTWVRRQAERRPPQPTRQSWI